MRVDVEVPVEVDVPEEVEVDVPLFELVDVAVEVVLDVPDDVPVIVPVCDPVLVPEEVEVPEYTAVPEAFAPEGSGSVWVPDWLPIVAFPLEPITNGGAARVHPSKVKKAQANKMEFTQERTKSLLNRTTGLGH